MIAASYWQDAWSVTTDPAHITAELIFTLIFDGLVLGIVWKLGIKRWIDRRIEREHIVLDKEHGVSHQPKFFRGRPMPTISVREGDVWLPGDGSVHLFDQGQWEVVKNPAPVKSRP